jgi:hypothetical protein
MLGFLIRKRSMYSSISAGVIRIPAGNRGPADNTAKYLPSVDETTLMSTYWSKRCITVCRCSEYGITAKVWRRTSASRIFPKVFILYLFFRPFQFIEYIGKRLNYKYKIEFFGEREPIEIILYELAPSKSGRVRTKPRIIADYDRAELGALCRSSEFLHYYIKGIVDKTAPLRMDTLLHTIDDTVPHIGLGSVYTSFADLLYYAFIILDEPSIARLFERAFPGDTNGLVLAQYYTFLDSISETYKNPSFLSVFDIPMREYSKTTYLLASKMNLLAIHHAQWNSLPESEHRLFLNMENIHILNNIAAQYHTNSVEIFQICVEIVGILHNILTAKSGEQSLVKISINPIARFNTVRLSLEKDIRYKAILRTALTYNGAIPALTSALRMCRSEQDYVCELTIPLYRDIVALGSSIISE